MTESIFVWLGVIISIFLISYGIIIQSEIAYIGFGVLLGSAASTVKFKKEGEKL